MFMGVIVSARGLKTAAISTNENLSLATFKLNSGMINTIFFPSEEIVKQVQDMGALGLGQVINQDVARESRYTARDTPDMQVMDCLNTWYLLYVLHQVFESNVFRDSFKENICCLTDDPS